MTKQLSDYFEKAKQVQAEQLARGYDPLPVGVIASLMALEDISDEEYEQFYEQFYRNTPEVASTREDEDAVTRLATPTSGAN